MQSKTCTACNTKFYSLTSDGFVKYFHRDKSLKSGFKYICKKCRSIYKKKLYKANPPKREIKPLLSKFCIVCSKPFQTKIEKIEVCCKECADFKKRVSSKLYKRENKYRENIKKQKLKELQSASKRRYHYKEDEIKFIKENINIYSTLYIAKKLGRTKIAIWEKIRKLKMQSKGKL
ncbi:hypothetical protein [Aliarcobacter cibarius]|uniref:Uncharacterized protein n=1 Tax=Aliarcobacter cibarius TaxID=255507 RepID=A0ABY2V534_9BACT|nr:hypothetical protein [Aliarcobacter cibarius]TLS99912.1 hypothetical protein FE247_05115 [Aliarcobacter cibarius]TLT00321.1 hypothetical protein FE245_05545 [Aliarcobacter cibarius]